MIPVKVSGLSSIKDVSSGENHSLALKDDGTVWAWGYNEIGQLGDGTSYRDGTGASHRSTPAQVSGLSGVVAVAGGVNHSLAVKDDGTVWAWGDNQYGKLGDGTGINRSTPVQVGGLSHVTDVAGGWSHSVALKDDGTVWAWGYNGFGQLGDGTTTNRATPVKVSGLSGVVDVSSGGGHILALKDDGTVWAWGQNNSGQLGVGTPLTDRTTPVQVSGLSGVVDVSAGGGQSLALKDDGTVWAWGAKYGEMYLKTIPEQVGGLSGITHVVGGMYHSFAVSTDIPPPSEDAPSPPTITSPQNDTYDTDGSFSVSGSADAGSTVELFEVITSKGATKADASSGAWSIDLSGVSDGAHTYKAKATDAQGNTSSFSNSVTVTVDKTAPAISSVYPASGATEVGLWGSVTASFSEKINPKTLVTTPKDPANPNVGTSTTFTLVKDGTTTPISATVSYDDYNKKAWLTPSTDLVANTTYTATIKGGSNGVKDLAGNALGQDYGWTFKTDGAPTVVNYTPTETSGVLRNTRPTATFSTDMDSSTLTATNIKFEVYDTKRRRWVSISHTVSCDATCETATLRPGSTLAASKQYQVTVTTNVKSSTGVALDQDANTSGNQPMSWTFTTGNT
jgi:hypothetical protein